MRTLCERGGPIVDGAAERRRPGSGGTVPPVLVAEITVEPFVEGAPGRHVTAAWDAARAVGLTVEHGPFGSTVAGEPDVVLATVDAMVRAAVAAGATSVALQVRRG